MQIIWLLVMSIMLLPHARASSNITSQIHEIDFGASQEEEVLVYLKSGDVARVHKNNLEILEKLQSTQFSKKWFKFTLNPDRVITAAKIIKMPKVTGFNKLLSLEDPDYVPTTVANMSIAKSYISEGKVPTKELTQCFNRAMVWSYEWWRNHSLKTNKVFIFWPKEYVRKYSFKWWFHVSPYVHVLDSDGVVKERVMDVKWLSRPYQFQDWADYHSSKDVKCKVVKNYSEYADHPFETDRCYFIRANMYTWQPADLEMKEAWGYTKGAFNMDEIRAAYLEAFDIIL
jgi:hypothetical protein